MNFTISSKRIFFVALAAISVAACSKQAEEPPPPLPASVRVLTVKTSPVELSDELPGRVAAFRTADIRPQVGGIVLRRLFEQGAEVKAGQTLFQLNPAPFQADVDIAAASLQRAEAVLARSRLQAERLQPLVAADAISRQSYDDAVSQRDQAAADVAQARAALSRRKLDLEFAAVKAPISGRIGQEMVTEGALVSLSDTNPMARIQQIDRVYVDVRQPVSTLEAIQAAAVSGKMEGVGKAPVTILSALGKPYPVTGRLLFSGISVDAGTGDAMVRVLVENPHRHLLPGMFVRARMPRSLPADGILVPQQAVLRSSTGQPRVWVLDKQGTARLISINVGDVVNHQYVVLGGLNVGDTLVVEGQERLQEDVEAAAQPWSPVPRDGGEAS